MEKENETPELSDIDYLRDLSERLMAVPCMYGTDQYDCDRLLEIAEAIEARRKIEQLESVHPGWRDMKHDNGAPIYSASGMLLDEEGNRSIFDDVAE